MVTARPNKGACTISPIAFCEHLRCRTGRSRSHVRRSRPPASARRPRDRTRYRERVYRTGIHHEARRRPLILRPRYHIRHHGSGGTRILVRTADHTTGDNRVRHSSTPSVAVPRVRHRDPVQNGLAICAGPGTCSAPPPRSTPERRMNPDAFVYISVVVHRRSRRTYAVAPPAASTHTPEAATIYTVPGTSTGPVAVILVLRPRAGVRYHRPRPTTGLVQESNRLPPRHRIHHRQVPVIRRGTGVRHHGSRYKTASRSRGSPAPAPAHRTLNTGARP